MMSFVAEMPSQPPQAVGGRVHVTVSRALSYKVAKLGVSHNLTLTVLLSYSTARE